MGGDQVEGMPFGRHFVEAFSPYVADPRTLALVRPHLYAYFATQVRGRRLAAAVRGQAESAVSGDGKSPWGGPAGEPPRMTAG